MSDPDRKGNPFISLLALSDQWSVKTSTLATVIEAHGCTGWDRYGRFVRAKAGDGLALAALDVLAALHDMYVEVEEKLPGFYEYWETKAGKAASNYGWPTDECPDFDAIDAGPQQPPQEPHGKRRNTYHRVLLALLAHAGITPGKHGAVQKLEVTIQPSHVVVLIRTEHNMLCFGTSQGGNFGRFLVDLG